MSDSDTPDHQLPEFASTADSNAGFGFGQPSDAWLKAKGYKKTHFKGGVERLGDDAMDIDEPIPQVEDSKERDRIRREKFLNQLEHTYQPPSVILPEQVIPQDTEKDRRRRELAEKRERAMKQSQNLSSEIRSLELASQSPVKKHKESLEEEKKREKLTKWIQEEPIGKTITKVPRTKLLDFSKLWTSETGDFTVFLRDGTFLKLHKSLVSARSTVFNSMFSSQLYEGQSNSLELYQNPEALKALFQFIYTGKLSCPSGLIIELLDLSNFYGIPGLKQLIEISLSKMLDKDNLSELFEVSITNDARLLYESCISYYSTHSKELRSISTSLPSELISIYKSRV